MTKGKLFVFSFLFLLSSCGSIVKTLAGFKNPKVENKENLNRYFKDVMPNEKTFFLTVKKLVTVLLFMTVFCLDLDRK